MSQPFALRSHYGRHRIITASFNPRDQFATIAYVRVAYINLCYFEIRCKGTMNILLFPNFFAKKNQKKCILFVTN